MERAVIASPAHGAIDVHAFSPLYELVSIFAILLVHVSPPISERKFTSCNPTFNFGFPSTIFIEATYLRVFHFSIAFLYLFTISSSSSLIASKNCSSQSSQYLLSINHCTSISDISSLYHEVLARIKSFRATSSPLRSSHGFGSV
jgi:hypothetical protein